MMLAPFPPPRGLLSLASVGSSSILEATHQVQGHKATGPQGEAVDALPGDSAPIVTAMPATD